MKKWMGNRRFVYNRVLDAVKKGKEKLNFFSLRNKFVTGKNNSNVEEWQLETPKDIRAGAIRDMIKNYKTNFTLLKQRQINNFNMSFCTKKNSPSIEIPKTAVKLENGLFLYKNYIKDKIKISQKQSKKKITIDYDCRLQVKNDKWYLNIPIKVEVKETNSKRKEICSLDPGSRSFQTIYSEDMVIQIKVNKKQLDKLRNKISLFKSLRDRNIIKRKRLTRKQRKIYFKIDNLIDDLHHKTINMLTTTYNHIILPSFESQDMVRRSNNKWLNRDMLQLKHFLFKERLKSKCILRKCTYTICTEEYTSKTCGKCGTINNVKDNDIFICSKCNLVIDRDINGARNIMIKQIKET